MLFKYNIPSCGCIVIALMITGYALLNFFNPGNLVGYLRLVKPGMTLEEVKKIIPHKYYQTEMKASGRYLVNVILNTGRVDRVLIYSQNEKLRFAYAQIFFRCEGDVLAINYTAEGFPSLDKQSIYVREIIH